MKLFLLPLIIFIGTKHDLKIAPFIAADLQAKYKTILHNRAHERFTSFTGAAYRARWGRHVFRIHKGLPAAYVVFGNETVSGRWQSGCINSQTILCHPKNITGCIAAIKDTWCQ